MINLEQYKTTNEEAMYKNIPIALLAEVKAQLKAEGHKLRIRYRGKRNHPADTRPQHHRYNWVLPHLAERFSVYIEGKTNRVYTPTPVKQPRTLYEFHKAVITTAYCYAESLEEAQKMMGSGAMFVSKREVGAQ